jgi:hypothetical protein
MVYLPFSQPPWPDPCSSSSLGSISIQTLNTKLVLAVDKQFRLHV